MIWIYFSKLQIDFEIQLTMSSQRGNVSRTRKQKHTNLTAYKNNKYGDTPATKKLNSFEVRLLEGKFMYI